LSIPLLLPKIQSASAAQVGLDPRFLDKPFLGRTTIDVAYPGQTGQCARSESNAAAQPEKIA